MVGDAVRELSSLLAARVVGFFKSRRQVAAIN